MTGRVRIGVYAGVATACGALCLHPIFSSLAWLWPVLGGVLVVTVAATAIRRFGAPDVLATLGALVALGLFLTAVYAHSHAVLGVLPWRGSWNQAVAVARDGFNDIAGLTTPVPSTTGITFLAAAGIGLVAILVDILAASLRRPAVAGLPLLALFTVPATVLPDGVGWSPFVFTAFGFLLLLLADSRDRVRRWGSPLVSRSRQSTGPGARQQRLSPPDTAPLAQLGRRLGVAAVCIAIVVPALIPGLHAGWFGSHSGAGAGFGPGGGTSVTALNPIVSLKRDLVESAETNVLTYRTNDPDPDYLRLTTLDDFNGTDWSPGEVKTTSKQRVTRGIPSPAGVVVRPSRTVQTQIAVGSFTEPWLPVPANPVKVDAPGDWRYDPASAVIVSPTKTTRDLSYTVTSQEIDPSIRFLENVVSPPATSPIYAKYLAYPDNVPQVVVELAHQVTADATSPYAKALALQEWFRSTFTYDLSVQPGNGDSALLSFLTDRRGYCEQFASAMALMARIVGIPARVDVGFTPGTKQPDGSWLVTTRDAHAWPELFFDGAGWLRFEPTPTGDGRTSVPGYTVPPAAVEPGATNPTASPSASSTTPTGALPSHEPRDPDARNNPTGPAKAISHHPFPVRGTIGASLLAILLVTPVGVRAIVRRRRWRDAIGTTATAHAAWLDLGDDVRDLGLRWHGDIDSPRRTAAQLLGTDRLRYDEGARDALTRLTRAEETARYAPAGSPERSGEGVDDLRADVQHVRRTLAGTLPRPRRWRALLVPQSSLQRLAGLGTRTGDVLTEVKRWITRAWTRLVRRRRLSAANADPSGAANAR